MLVFLLALFVELCLVAGVNVSTGETFLSARSAVTLAGPPVFSGSFLHAGSATFRFMAPDMFGGMWAVLSGSGVMMLGTASVTSYAQQLIVVRYDSQWGPTKTASIDFAVTDSNVGALVADGAGGAWVVGTFDQSMTIPGATPKTLTPSAPPQSDCFVILFDSNVDHIASGKLSTAGSDTCVDATRTVDGRKLDLVVAGRTEATTYTFGPVPYNRPDTVPADDSFILTVRADLQSRTISIERHVAMHGGDSGVVKIHSIATTCADGVGGLVSSPSYVALISLGASATLDFGVPGVPVFDSNTVALLRLVEGTSVVMSPHDVFEVLAGRSFGNDNGASRYQLATLPEGGVWVCGEVTGSLVLTDFGLSASTDADADEMYIRFDRMFVGKAQHRVVVEEAMVGACRASDSGGLWMVGSPRKSLHSRGSTMYGAGATSADTAQVLMELSKAGAVESVMYFSPAAGSATFRALSVKRAANLIVGGYLDASASVPYDGVNPVSGEAAVSVFFTTPTGVDVWADGYGGCPPALPVRVDVVPSSQVLGGCPDGEGGYFLVVSGSMLASYRGMWLPVQRTYQLIVAHFNSKHSGIAATSLDWGEAPTMEAVVGVVSDRARGVWLVANRGAASPLVAVDGAGGAVATPYGGADGFIAHFDYMMQLKAWRYVGGPSDDWVTAACEWQSHGGVALGMTLTGGDIAFDPTVRGPRLSQVAEFAMVVAFTGEGDAVGASYVYSDDVNEATHIHALTLDTGGDGQLVASVSASGSMPVQFFGSSLMSDTDGPWLVKFSPRTLNISSYVKYATPAAGVFGHSSATRHMLVPDGSGGFFMCGRVAATFSDLVPVVIADATSNEFFVHFDSTFSITNHVSFNAGGGVGFSTQCASDGRGGLWSHGSVNTDHVRGTGTVYGAASPLWTALTHFTSDLRVDFVTQPSAPVINPGAMPMAMGLVVLPTCEVVEGVSADISTPISVHSNPVTPSAGAIAAGGGAAVVYKAPSMCAETTYSELSPSYMNYAALPVVVPVEATVSLVLADGTGGAWVAASAMGQAAFFNMMLNTHSGGYTAQILLARLDGSLTMASAVVSFYASGSTAPTAIVPDGAGGVWLLAEVVNGYDPGDDVIVACDPSTDAVAVRYDAAARVVAQRLFSTTSVDTPLAMARYGATGVVVSVATSAASLSVGGATLVSGGEGGWSAIVALDGMGAVVASTKTTCSDAMCVMRVVGLATYCSRQLFGGCGVMMLHETSGGVASTFSYDTVGDVPAGLVLAVMSSELRYVSAKLLTHAIPQGGSVSSCSIAVSTHDAVWLGLATSGSWDWVSEGRTGTYSSISGVVKLDPHTWKAVGPVSLLSADGVVHPLVPDAEGGVWTTVHSVSGFSVHHVGDPVMSVSSATGLLRFGPDANPDVARPFASVLSDTPVVYGPAFTHDCRMLLGGSGFDNFEQAPGGASTLLMQGSFVAVGDLPMCGNVRPPVVPQWNTDAVGQVGGTEVLPSSNVPADASFTYSESAYMVNDVIMRNGGSTTSVGTSIVWMERIDLYKNVLCYVPVMVQDQAIKLRAMKHTTDRGVWAVLVVNGVAASATVSAGAASQSVPPAPGNYAILLHLDTACTPTLHVLPVDVEVDGVIASVIAPLRDGGVVYAVRPAAPFVDGGVAVAFESGSDMTTMVRASPTGVTLAAWALNTTATTFSYTDAVYDCHTSAVYVTMAVTAMDTLDFRDTLKDQPVVPGMYLLMLNPYTLVAEGLLLVARVAGALPLGTDGGFVVPKLNGGVYVIISASTAYDVDGSVTTQFAAREVVVVSVSEGLIVEASQRLLVDAAATNMYVSDAKPAPEGLWMHVRAIFLPALGGPLRSSNPPEAVGWVSSPQGTGASTLVFLSYDTLRVEYVAPFVLMETGYVSAGSPSPELKLLPQCRLAFTVASFGFSLAYGNKRVLSISRAHAGTTTALVVLERAHCDEFIPDPCLAPPTVTPTTTPCRESVKTVVNSGGAAESADAPAWDWPSIKPLKAFKAIARCVVNTAADLTARYAAAAHDYVTRPLKYQQAFCDSVAVSDGWVAVGGGGIVDLYARSAEGSHFVRSSGLQPFPDGGTPTTTLRVAVSGVVLAVGTPADDSAQPFAMANRFESGKAGSGAVHVYERVNIAGADEFLSVAYLKPPFAFEPQSEFGASVTVSADGRVLVVGMPGDSRDTGTESIDVNTVPVGGSAGCARCGAVGVFARTAYSAAPFGVGNGYWTPTLFLKEPGLSASNVGREFGGAVAIVGAWPSYYIVATGRTSTTLRGYTVTTAELGLSGTLLGSEVLMPSTTTAATWGAVAATEVGGLFVIAVAAPGDDGCEAGVVTEVVGPLMGGCPGRGGVWVFECAALGLGCFTDVAVVKAPYTSPAASVAVGASVGVHVSAVTGTLTLSIGAPGDIAAGVGYQSISAVPVAVDTVAPAQGAVYAVGRSGVGAYSFTGILKPLHGDTRMLGDTVGGGSFGVTTNVAAHDRVVGCGQGKGSKLGGIDPVEHEVGDEKGQLVGGKL